MLTQNDLSQIKLIVQDETKKSVQVETGKIVREEIKLELDPLKKDVSAIKSDVSVLKTDVSGLKMDVKELKRDTKVLKKDVKKIKGDVNLVIDHFDREDLSLQNRVEKIENHLRIPCTP